MAYYIMTKLHNPSELVKDTIFDEHTLADFRSRVEKQNRVQQRANAALKTIDSIEAMIDVEPFDIVSDYHHLRIICDSMIVGLISTIIGEHEFEYVDVCGHAHNDRSEIIIDLDNPESGFDPSGDDEKYAINMLKRFLSEAREKYQRLVKFPENDLGYRARLISISELRLEDL